MSVVHVHLVLNHIPVVGVLIVLLVLAAAFAKKNDAIGKLGLAMLVGVGLVTAVVYFTGEPAEEAVENLAGVSEAIIHSHEEAAEVAFIATNIAALAALGFLFWNRRRMLPRWTVAVSLALTLAVSGLMAWTANIGGQIRHTEIRSEAAGEVIDSEDGDR